MKMERKTRISGSHSDQIVELSGFTSLSTLISSPPILLAPPVVVFISGKRLFQLEGRPITSRFQFRELGLEFIEETNHLVKIVNSPKTCQSKHDPDRAFFS